MLDLFSNTAGYSSTDFFRIEVYKLGITNPFYTLPSLNPDSSGGLHDNSGSIPKRTPQNMNAKPGDTIFFIANHISGGVVDKSAQSNNIVIACSDGGPPDSSGNCNLPSHVCPNGQTRDAQGNCPAPVVPPSPSCGTCTETVGTTGKCENGVQDITIVRTCENKNPPAGITCGTTYPPKKIQCGRMMKKVVLPFYGAMQVVGTLIVLGLVYWIIVAARQQRGKGKRRKKK